MCINLSLAVTGYLHNVDKTLSLGAIAPSLGIIGVMLLIVSHGILILPSKNIANKKAVKHSPTFCLHFPPYLTIGGKLPQMAIACRVDNFI